MHIRVHGDHFWTSLRHTTENNKKNQLKKTKKKWKKQKKGKNAKERNQIICLVTIVEDMKKAQIIWINYCLGILSLVTKDVIKIVKLEYKEAQMIQLPIDMIKIISSIVNYTHQFVQILWKRLSTSTSTSTLWYITCVYSAQYIAINYFYLSTTYQNQLQYHIYSNWYSFLTSNPQHHCDRLLSKQRQYNYEYITVDMHRL